MHATATMHRNWSAICREKNGLLRLLVSTCEDERVLAGLKSGFPELFQDTPGEVRVPVTALREAARRYYDEFRQSEFAYEELQWQVVLGDFNIPVAACWSTGDNDGPQQPPADVVQQLVGQKTRACIPVNYRGMPCYVVGIERSGPHFLEDTILQHKDVKYLSFLCLVSRSFIDTNA